MSEIQTRITTRRRRSSVGIVRAIGSPLRTTMPPLPWDEPTPSSRPPTLLNKFIDAYKELDAYRSGKPVLLDGQTLSIAAVTAVSRYSANVELDGSPIVKARVNNSRAVIEKKVAEKSSIYGVSTGFGGSADTRTDDPLLLGNALLQLLQAGVLPSSTSVPDALPLLDPMGTVMSESWVRAAIVVRMNSLIRGHSGVRWELLERMNSLLKSNITPLVPLRGSISASGDLQPLSYIAGTLMGSPAIRVFDGPAAFGRRQIVSSKDALAAHGIEPLPLASKEHLGLLNGTAFSAAVASLALTDAVHLALLAQVCTAMGTEALAGSRGSFDPFIHDVARPHPGQIESAKIVWDLLEGSKFAITSEQEVTIEEDEGVLRQDRYPLRTAPQWIGPQIQDLISSLETITLECNSTTDNPLIDASTGKIHNGGNFQAMAVTNAMEKTRLGLHHLGKLLFAQLTELLNPTMNRGLPPSLAATDPSLNYHAKGIDIATASYVAELGYRAAPVSTHVQSAEMHNQAVNSLALISARATIDSLEMLSLLTASYLYVLCQALDLRAMQTELVAGLDKIVERELTRLFSIEFSPKELSTLISAVRAALHKALDETSTMDAHPRMIKVAAASTTVLVDAFTAWNKHCALVAIPAFREAVSTQAEQLLDGLRRSYLLGERGAAPASQYLNKTRPVYEFVRVKLGIKMHGSENYGGWVNGLGVDEDTTGGHVSLIHEAIRDGKLQPIIVGLFA
ncbi:Phenylalanine ammonia-lyase [Mycena indigotica]|uniref:Phenylalanine ammonia-lyase n=1 Tax=Mycena indigotica TaxID=2126181 RepID=A0A8H6WET2_9AGAR|nr:Phenylalanine ammonia-lyase [Mycena indigotica]KAF7315137.1 Phenylalanine ammonia-lyase [Mycena indigotica]